MTLPNWHRAHGTPLFKAGLRTQPVDFQVTEQLGWALSGTGEHDYLWVEKTGANTEWVAKQLAAFAEVPARDVGFAGLKDRHAVTRQWFSIPRWHSPDWQQWEVEGVEILEVGRHLRKLRRGAHAANVFTVVLRYLETPDPGSIEERLARIAEQGVPNYFGEQRFGRNAGNLKLADDWAAGKRLPRPKKSLAISTIRSFVFNEMLSTRVHDRSWNQLVAGEKANLDGSGSVFQIETIDAELAARCQAMDVHPAIALPGEGSAVQRPNWQAALDRTRVEPGSRAARLRVADLSMEMADNSIELRFTLGRGAFATSVLREICAW